MNLDNYWARIVEPMTQFEWWRAPFPQKSAEQESGADGLPFLTQFIIGTPNSDLTRISKSGLSKRSCRAAVPQCAVYYSAPLDGSLFD